MKNVGHAIRGWVVGGAVWAATMGTAVAIDTTGWACSGTLGTQCGSATADGVVTNAPVGGSAGYAWVSTADADPFPASDMPAGIDSSEVTNGATYTSAPFTVAAGTDLSFYFNYVGTDGSSDFPDMAWARLVDNTGNQVALLFTARTTTAADTVPGFGMPTPTATITPATVPMIAGAPVWSPLGDESGECFSAGCGYTGWVHASYTIANAGTYRLEIGAVNWGDTAYDLGLAVDGLLVGGVPPGVTPVPALDTLGLVSLTVALGALGWRRRQRT